MENTHMHKMFITYPPGEHETNLKIINYKCRLPEIIYLCNKILSRHLSQDCIDLIIYNLLTREECIKFGYTTMLAPPYSDKEWITLVYRNKQEELAAAYAKYPVFKFSWLMFAIRKGCLESLKFLHERYLKLYGNTENFQLIDDLVDEFLDIDPSTECKFEYESKKRYLSDGFPGLCKSEEDLIAVMEWMHNNGYSLSIKATKHIICNELVKVGKWIDLYYPQFAYLKQESMWRFNYQDIDDCIENGRLDQVEKLLNKGDEITFDNILNCLCERNFDLFKWLYSRYASFDETNEFCDMCVFIPRIDKPFDFIDFLSNLIKPDFINLIDWEVIMDQSKLEVFEYALHKLGNYRVASECRRSCKDTIMRKVLENFD